VEEYHASGSPPLTHTVEIVRTSLRSDVAGAGPGREEEEEVCFCMSLVRWW
jgi:hypothetical protein